MSGPAAKTFGSGTPGLGDIIAQKFRVERVVGRGGMGVVVAARHVQLGQVVAIKLLTVPPDEERREEAIARFLHEAQAAARLHGDHVVRIYDVGQLESGLPFIVMELLDGSDLGQMLDERGPLPEAEAVDYVLQACAGVSEAHQLGIVHRDLKPSNLFVTKRSDGFPLLKVLDFGISKQLSDPSSGEAGLVLTNTRTLMGSPNYMSPEQIRDARRVDARADVWALGIILQELITNAPVFRGESFPGVCAAIVADPPMPVRTMRPDVSAKLEAIIDRCLEKDVQRRYQSVADLAADLSPLGSRASVSSGPQALVYSSQPRLVTVDKPTGSGSPALSLDGPTEATHTGPGATRVDGGPRATRVDGDPGATRVDGTLPSARLPTTGNLGGTQSALSSPDSRIELAHAPPAPRTIPRPASRWWLPAAIAVLLLAGAVWFPRHIAAPAPTSDADARTPGVTLRSFTLHIESEPTGASVSEGSVRLGTTPFSLAMSSSEGSSPRVFVVERDGYQPYVIRQGEARGEVRVLASLLRLTRLPPLAGSGSASPPETTSARPVKPRPTVAKPAATPPAQPPNDIRLER